MNVTIIRIFLQSFHGRNLEVILYYFPKLIYSMTVLFRKKEMFKMYMFDRHYIEKSFTFGVKYIQNMTLRGKSNIDKRYKYTVQKIEENNFDWIIRHVATEFKPHKSIKSEKLENSIIIINIYLL